MAYVAGHLSVSALEARYEACADVTSSRHFQTIWLLAKGHSTGEVAALTSFGQRWIEQLLERLRLRVAEPPPDGGVWTSGKASAWMAGELGLSSLAPQRGWEALRAIGWSIQRPRPRNPKAATPEQQDAFKKKSRTPSPRKRPGTPAFRSRRSPPTSTGSA